LILNISSLTISEDALLVVLQIVLVIEVLLLEVIGQSLLLAIIVFRRA
jgi:hypothetical protein